MRPGLSWNRAQVWVGSWGKQRKAGDSQGVCTPPSRILRHSVHTCAIFALAGLCPCRQLLAVADAASQVLGRSKQDMERALLAFMSNSHTFESGAAVFQTGSKFAHTCGAHNVMCGSGSAMMRGLWAGLSSELGWPE